MQLEMQQTALGYLEKGLSVLPANVQLKFPALSHWKTYQDRLPTWTEVHAWFSNPHSGLCVVTGAVSGNLEMIDFDFEAELFDDWQSKILEAAPDLLPRLVVETTQSGGRHVIYRCREPISGNLKLAQRKIPTANGDEIIIAKKPCKPRQDKDGTWSVTITLIETRGQGGLFLCDPTPGYNLEQGNLTDIPTITAEQRELLLEAAWSLNEVIPEPEPIPTYTGSSSPSGSRPGDEFNARGDMRAILQAHGWVRVKEGEREYWRRPGKQIGWSATLKDGSFYVWSTNAEPFREKTTYSPFAVYAHLEHHGDFSRAASELAKQGYGQKLDTMPEEVISNLTGKNIDEDPWDDGSKSLTELIASFQGLNKPIIHGLLREGETMNIIASSKIGKSWLVNSLTISIAAGMDWLGLKVDQGCVLLIDNELHQNTTTYRFMEVIIEKLSGHPRCVIPVGCTELTMFVDVQQKALFWMVCGWESDFTGYVLDYGTWPDQKRTFFTLRDLRRTLAHLKPEAGLEGQIYHGLEQLCEEKLSVRFRREDGLDMKIGRCLVDANWGQSTDVVYQFCRQSRFSGIVLPSHGKYVGASSIPFSEYKRKKGDKIGLHWRLPNIIGKRAVRHILIDTNYWKSFVQARLSVAMGDPGCLSLFGRDASVHRLLAEHLTAEYCIRTAARDRVVDEWKLKAIRPDNGRSFDGPLYVIRRSVLKEISFVDNAADGGTVATVAAAQEETLISEKDTSMDEKNKEKSTETPVKEESPKTPETIQAKAPDVVDPVAQMRQRVADETLRIGSIQQLCGGKHPDIEARAIAEGWDATRCELEVLRASRPTAPAAHVKSQPNDPKIFEAVALMAAGVPDGRMQASYEAQVLDAADRLRGIGIQEFCERISGASHFPRFRREASGWLQAAFSTMSLPGILSNVANKMLLEGYNYIEDAWRKICKIASVNDFKEHTRYRMTGSFAFEKVGADGELKHGKLDEMSFGQKADTHGIMFALTRQMIINDDLGAFADVPRSIGMGAAEAIADAVWALLLSNPNAFFSAAHKNYLAGADTALSVDSLTAAEVLFSEQTKPNGRPLGISPTILLVPTALKVAAQLLMTSVLLNETTTANKGKPANNPHVGKFEVVFSSYLANASFAGASSKAWYLMADPNRLPALEVAFLNGVDRPTVEKTDADFNTLGIQFRGYIDFGVREQDFRGGLLMKGEQ